LDPRIIRWYMD